MTAPPTPTAQELGTLLRLTSVFLAQLSVTEPMTPLQAAGVDMLLLALSRSAVPSMLERQQTYSLKLKIDRYYGVVPPTPHGVPIPAPTPPSEG